MLVCISRGGDVIRGDPPHQSIHKEAADNHSGECGLPDCIVSVHGGGDNSRDETDGALVGSRCGKQAGGINKEEVHLKYLTD